MTQQLHPWQNNEKFRSLDPKKQENIRFTAEENELLTELFTENLSASGQKQYEFIKPFLQSGLSR